MVKLSVLAKWLARKTALRTSLRISTKPRPKSAYDFRFIALFHCFIVCLPCLWPHVIYFSFYSTARYSLFVLKVPLNTNQPTNWCVPMLSVFYCCWLGNRKDIRPVNGWALVRWWWWGSDGIFARLRVRGSTTATSHHLLLQQNPECFDIQLPADRGFTGIWPLNLKPVMCFFDEFLWCVVASSAAVLFLAVFRGSFILAAYKSS